MSSGRFIARRGLALRAEVVSYVTFFNSYVLGVRMMSQYFSGWKKSAKKHASPGSQNEMLKLMAHSVQWVVLRDIQCAPFLAVMVD